MGTSSSPAASTVQYGRLRNGTLVPPADPQHWQGDATWSPATTGAAGRRKQRQGLHYTVAAGNPAAVTQGLELLLRLLAAGQTAASSIALSTKGGLPAASSPSDITGGAPATGAAAPAWGLARVAALEYADCRWHGADVSSYTQQAPQVLPCLQTDLSISTAQQYLLTCFDKPQWLLMDGCTWSVGLSQLLSHPSLVVHWGWLRFSYCIRA